MGLLVKNGHLLDPSSGLDGIGHLVIEGQQITAVEVECPEESGFDQVIDASGMMVLPGLIDMHVHLREPGGEDKETIESGSLSAVCGGFTTVACMPNTDPVIDNKMGVEFVRAKAMRYGHCTVRVIGAITKGLEGKALAEIADLVDAGVVAISDDGKTVERAEIMRRAMEYVRMFSIPIVVHCEEPSLSLGGAMNEGFNSTRLGLRGISRLAEEIIVSRDVMMAERLGCRLHVAHVSTRDAVEMIRQAKQRGVQVTAEVTPHHLTLTDDEIERYDPNFKMSPPLRTADDREALIEGLMDGTIDAIASDHAPHTNEEKDVEFEYAPNGVIGLETTFPVCYTSLVASGRVSMSLLVQKLANNPGAILGLKDRGSLRATMAADVTVVDVNKSVVIDSERFRSKSRNTPFGGFSGKGSIEWVLVNGRVEVANGSTVTGD